CRRPACPKRRTAGRPANPATPESGLQGRKQIASSFRPPRSTRRQGAFEILRQALAHRLGGGRIGRHGLPAPAGVVEGVRGADETVEADRRSRCVSSGRIGGGGEAAAAIMADFLVRRADENLNGRIGAVAPSKPVL